MSKITRAQFSFGIGEYGRKKVTYRTPVRGDYWECTTQVVFVDEIYDLVEYDEYPPTATMLRLRWLVIHHGTHYDKHGNIIPKMP